MRNFLLHGAAAVAASLLILHAEPKDKAQPLQFEFKQGKISLRDGLATLNVPKEYRFLDAENSRKLIEEGWGNPPGSGGKAMGMIVPADISPLAKESWGVIITYEEDGYVKDDEAEKIDYSKLLQEMKESVAEESKEREKEGYASIALLGWAAPPRYDKATHKMYWAKELKFGDSPEPVLNYNIRVLGRHGVLVLNAVGGKSQFAMIETAMGPVMGFVEFNPGSRYTDFIPGTDKVAAYGLGALVAGKLAAKAGLFKVLIGALIAGKKFVVAALVGLGGLISKLFGGRKKEQPAVSSEVEVTSAAGPEEKSASSAAGE